MTTSTSLLVARRLWCILRQRHGRKPMWGGARSDEEQVDVQCSRCGQTIVEGYPATLAALKDAFRY
jgi:hypothetical protein